MKSIERAVKFVDRISTPFLEFILKFISHSKRFDSLFQWIETRNIRKLQHPNKFLIVPDINIGDAINHQPFIATLKKCFPESEIHYVYKKKAFPLIKSNPYVDVHHPLFQSRIFPSSRDLENLKKIIIKNNYNLIFNFCPYMPFSTLRYERGIVIHPIRFISRIIRAYYSSNQKAHIAFQLNQFAKEIAFRINPSMHIENINKMNPFIHRIYLDQDLYFRAERTAEKLGISSRKKIVFFNPDSSSPYTLIPIEIQIQIMKAVLSMPSVGQVLMNEGLSYKNIEKKILNQITENLKRKIIMIPSDIPIDIYAALTDKADLFISADTGPMHISAAEKVMINSRKKFKNQTALIAIFGATPSKLYGYDSFSNEHIDTPQNAPAKIFEGHPPCKNITCTDKTLKNCSQIKCFEGVVSEKIINYIESLL